MNRWVARVVRVVREAAPAGAKNTVELLEVGADDIAVEMHHRVEAVHEGRSPVRDPLETDAVVAEVDDIRRVAEATLEKVDVLLIDVDEVQRFGKGLSFSLFRPWPGASSTTVAKSQSSISGQIRHDHCVSRLASASS